MAVGEGEPLRLEVIVGSVREKRLGSTVADWFVRRARTDAAFDVGVIDLLDFPAAIDPTLAADTTDYRARLGGADAFVAVTPEYNHGPSGALKNAFDAAKHEWRAKPIGFVSYGGLSGGLRATEQLRLVVAELHMVSIRETVSIHQVRKAFDENAEVRDGAAIDATGRLLRQLAWWGRTLRAPRPTDPYPA